MGNSCYVKETPVFKSVMKDVDGIFMDNNIDPHCSIGNGWLCSQKENNFQEIFYDKGKVMLFS